MPDPRPELLEFIESYRLAFERLDLDAVIGHLAFPWHLSGDNGRSIELLVVDDEAASLPLLERLLATYRRIGVASVRVEEVRGWDVSENLAQVRVHWRLFNAERAVLYDFHAGYTLVKKEAGWRISAVAHDELIQLRRLSSPR